MPTLKEIYEGQSNWVFGTNYTSLKSDTETLIEQETSGIRIKSAVELNNPLIYGNEATRISLRSTPSIEKMKDSTGPDGGIVGGLIGEGLGKITGGGFGKAVFGGKVTSLNQARDGINSKLGIPSNPIPTFVQNHGGLQKGKEQDTMITLGEIKNDANGTEVGKFLKQTGGGNFRTIGRNIIGQGISLVKDKVRDELFGSPLGLGENEPTNGLYEYSSQTPYSATIRNVKNNEPEVDKIQTQTQEKIDELKSKTKNLLNKNKKIGEEKTEDTSSTEESKYSDIIRQEQVDDREEGTFSRIDLTKIPGNNAERTPKLFRTKGGLSDLGIPQNNPYDEETGYTSTIGKSSHEQRGLTSNSGDLINSAGVPIDGVYKDGDVTYSKSEMEALDLIPFWISGLDSSVPLFFRTLITGVSENVSPSWSSGKFVGNPYNYYTYEGVERNVTFNLNLYCMNEYELMKNWERITYLTSKAYPSIKDNLVYPPFIRFRLGDIYKNKTGFIESLTYTLPDTGVWETETDGSLLPKFIDVAMTIKFVEVPGSELALYGYTKSEAARQSIKEELNSESEESVSGAPVTGQSGGGESKPVIIDNSGQVTDKAPEEENSQQGDSKGVTNINTGKKEQTPKIQSDETIDGKRMITFSSEADTTSEERYKKIKEIISDRNGALKLTKRYGSSKRYLIELKKEKENIYYLKEEISKPTGNETREYAYKQEKVYGTYPRGSITIWYFQKWDIYLKEQKKSSETEEFGGIYNG